MTQAAPASRATDVRPSVHVVWPLPDAQPLIGDVSDEAKAAERDRLEAYISKIAGDQGEVHWRRPPTWCSNRDFVTKGEWSWLSARATVVFPA